MRKQILGQSTARDTQHPAALLQARARPLGLQALWAASEHSGRKREWLCLCRNSRARCSGYTTCPCRAAPSSCALGNTCTGSARKARHGRAMPGELPAVRQSQKWPERGAWILRTLSHTGPSLPPRRVARSWIPHAARVCVRKNFAVGSESRAAI